MDITGVPSRQNLISWARKLTNEVAGHADPAIVENLRQAVDDLELDRFVLAVLGKAKRGKSTLLNALLERTDDQVAPVDKLPASSAVSRFRWAVQEQATVVYRNGAKQAISFPQIKEFVTEEYNPENNKGVDVVEIEGPFVGLERGLDLIDTPGAASIHEHHDAILHAFIPQSDAVIFLVTGRMPLDQDELDLLEKVKAADISKVFFVINRVDEASETDLLDAERHNKALLSRVSVNVEQMHRISAKRAFSGDQAASGVPELMTAIARFLASHKSPVLNARFVCRVLDITEPLVQAIELDAANSEKSTTQLQQDLTSLRDKKRRIESERELAERQFRLAWKIAVEAFERALEDAKSHVTAEVSRRFDNTAVLDVSKLAKELPTWLNNQIGDHVAPLARRFEEASRDACEQLQSDYPNLHTREGGVISIRTKDGLEFVTGSASGIAAAATGVGLAAAGSTAAASIAAANAAALSATTTVAAPSFLSGLLSWAGLEMLTPLATGTATVAAPTAITATPLWVALAGPVGWTLAGIGALAVPFSWRLSKLKLKDKLGTASLEQVEKVFATIYSNRLPALRSMGKAICEDFQIRLDRQLKQIETVIMVAIEQRASGGVTENVDSLTAKARQLRKLLEEPTGLLLNHEQSEH